MVKDNSQHSKDLECYIGKEYSGGKLKMIYVGAPYYQDHAQIHLTPEQARWLQARLNRMFPKRKPAQARKDGEGA